MNIQGEVIKSYRREIMSLPTRGGDMSYLVLDGPRDDAPTLIFSHATGFHAHLYARILEPLSECARVIIIDQRGHGCTTLPADPSQLKNWYVYRNDLIAFMEADGHGAYVLSGHSFGGTVSLLVAQAVPAKVSSLVLFEPVLPPALFGRLFYPLMKIGFLRRRVKVVHNASKRRPIWSSKEDMIERYRGRGAFRTWPEDLLKDYVEGAVRPHEKGGFELLCRPQWESANFTAQSHNVWKHLESVRCPVTVLRGERNSTFRARMIGRFERLLSQANVKTITGTSHSLPMERVDLVQEELETALKGSEGS